MANKAGKANRTPPLGISTAGWNSRATDSRSPMLAATRPITSCAPTHHECGAISSTTFTFAGYQVNRNLFFSGLYSRPARIALVKVSALMPSLAAISATSSCSLNNCWTCSITVGVNIAAPRLFFLLIKTSGTFFSIQLDWALNTNLGHPKSADNLHLLSMQLTQNWAVIMWKDWVSFSAWLNTGKLPLK